MNSRVGAVTRLLFIDLIGSVVWFPVWWYTKGLALVISKVVASLRYRYQEYSFRIWIKNFFIPMYGQYDLTGRLVSVFMRSVVLVGRSIAIVVEALFYVVLLVLWLLAPPCTLLFAFWSGLGSLFTDNSTLGV
jgi:hypothetical protein